MDALKILDDDISHILISIYYYNMNGDCDIICYEYDDIPSLMNGLKNFKYPYDHFINATLHVRPLESTLSNIRSLMICDLVITDNQYVYNVIELQKILEKILNWIDERPELLI